MDASFWAFVGLILFLALIVYLGVPQKIVAALDGRATRISTELEEARRLREEAQALLSDYQRKQRDAEQEAADIIAQAEANAVRMSEDAKQSLEELIARRTRMAETKIAQAEAQAVQDVRAVAADAAVAAAERILSDQVTGKTADAQITASITEIKTRLQ